MVTSIDKIKKNPLYYASLSSKELFHSNFLAWIWETNNECFKKILGIENDINSENYELKREYLNIDLTIVKKATTEVVVAIENKVKDIPRKEQLVEYSDKLKGLPDCKKILITMIKPGNDIEELSGWKVLQYNEVAQKLREYLQQNIICNRHKTYLEDYESLISDLSKLINSRIENINESYWFKNDKKLSDLYESIRLEDTIKKYNALKLASDVITACNEDEEIKNFIEKATEYFKNGYGINNKRPCVDFHLLSKNKKVTQIIQIEGNQYRRAIEVSGYHETDKKKLEVYIENSDKYNSDKYEWLFSPKDRHNKNNDINIYANKDRTKGTFIYSYKKIGDGIGQIPIVSLVEQIINDIKKSIKLLNSDEYINRFEIKQHSPPH